jgi:hypothetical protein
MIKTGGGEMEEDLAVIALVFELNNQVLFLVHFQHGGFFLTSVCAFLISASIHQTTKLHYGHGTLIVTEERKRQKVVSHLQSSEMSWSLIKLSGLEINRGWFGLDFLKFFQFATHRSWRRKLFTNLRFHNLLNLLHIFSDSNCVSSESSSRGEERGKEGGLEDHRHGWELSFGCDNANFAQAHLEETRILKGHFFSFRVPSVKEIRIIRHC